MNTKKILWITCILFGPTRVCSCLQYCHFGTSRCSNLTQSVWHLEAARLCGCSVCFCNRRGPRSHNSLGSPTKAYISEWPVTRQTNTGQMETGERADLTWHQLQRRSAARVGFCKTRGNLFGVSQRRSGAVKANVFGRRGWCCYNDGYYSTANERKQNWSNCIIVTNKISQYEMSEISTWCS